MPENAEEVQEIERVVSKRFKNKEGKAIPFRFKAITTERIDELEKLHTIPVYSGSRKRKTGEKVDQSRFMAHMAVESTIYPDFKSPKMRKGYKTQDPIEVAKKMLHVGGEYSEWLATVNEINGFDDSVEELEEAAKN
nr:phage portal protein [Sporosarcina sp. resist]